MKWLTQHWRGHSRVLAAILICAGAFCGYWWLYKMGPFRRVLDPEWYASHSQREYWREVQRGIHRGMWSHDDGFTVGMYGDKPWAQWIMARVKPGTSMGCMGSPCHSASSMRYITNQDLGEDADAWLAWWDTNQSKSQEEWIADGFRRRGFDIDVPPTAAQTPTLLALLDKAETDRPNGISKEMQYNAFRCLRDSGFEPVAFALSNRTVSAEIERGLLEYAKSQRRWPSDNGVGILSFGRKDDDWGDIALPLVLKDPFRTTANALVFGLPLLGAAILICSFFRRHSSCHG